jgi:probable F420-dependent oxidoreductase
VDFALTFGRLAPSYFEEVAVAADGLGYESIWLPEHLVFPVEMRGQLRPGEEHPPVPASTPVFDAAAYLSFIAGRTRHIRLGTFVYLLGLRHPFVGARAFATLDVVSGGRAEVGVGAGWLETEWEAVGLDPKRRGRHLDEAIGVCRRLWTEEVVSHEGDVWSFPPVMFEPKPVQSPLPVVVGGESDRALRRAAELGDGWIGMAHTPESVKPQVERLRELEQQFGRADRPLKVTVMGDVAVDGDVDRWEAAGVDRLVVVPWTRSREALAGLYAFADRHFRS